MLLETYLSFFGVAALLALSPGPDNAFVVALSAAQGFRRGMLLTLGLCSGLIIHTLLAVAGLNALLMASPTAFSLLAIAGALYLIWLAFGMWNSHTPTQSAAVNQTGTTLYQRGLLMNLSNPKVVIFFVALLPQFAGGAQASSAVLITLGAIMVAATLVVFGSLAMGAVASHLLWHYLLH